MRRASDTIRRHATRGLHLALWLACLPGGLALAATPAATTFLRSFEPAEPAPLASAPDPRFNLEFGQSFIETMRRDSSTAGQLPRVIASYNAGPLPVARWAGVRNARQFGPRCMQSPVAGKLDFRSTAMSEDCLYLNVWTGANGADQKLPVLVYFHGGALVSGDGSEPRYDGANLASRGMVAVTVNYRLGAFGFLAPPGAARSSNAKFSGSCRCTSGSRSKPRRAIDSSTLRRTRSPE